jgi:hypothetical protein
VNTPVPDSRLIRAATELSATAKGGGHVADGLFLEAVADLLGLIGTDYAPYWQEPYAAPFVPVIEKALRVAVIVNRDDAT